MVYSRSDGCFHKQTGSQLNSAQVALFGILPDGLEL